MLTSNMYYSSDDSAILHELQKINNEVEEELSKPNANKQKVYNLRFQQLMKGIYLTQAPITTIYG